MNPLRIFCVVVCFLAATNAASTNQQQRQQEQQKPIDWISSAELQALPSLDELSLQKLEKMSLQEGAKLVDKLYHLSQLNGGLEPSFVPSPNNVPAIIIKPNGQKVISNLNRFVATAKQQPNFGQKEVTIFITGLPQQTETIKKATQKLVQAYLQRYNGQQRQQKNSDNDDLQSAEYHSESTSQSSNTNAGNLLIIDLGAVLNTPRRFALLDVDQTGAMLGKVLIQLTEEADVPREIIHIVAQGIGAHVAGAAARQFTRTTGHKLRRITALNPSKIYAKSASNLNGLARGDAEFVDAIHTSAYGMGTEQRVGDVDFYPNGPSIGVPGADNVVEAAMRATRYFAESVRPGNERNFPAVAANSLQQYKTNKGNGKRAFMGIKADFDIEGDYVLEVNPNSPFGKGAGTKKEKTVQQQNHRNSNEKNNN